MPKKLSRKKTLTLNMQNTGKKKPVEAPPEPKILEHPHFLLGYFLH